MKVHIVLSLLTVGALVAGTSHRAWAQDDHLGIHRAVEVEFHTQPGHYYHLQHSTNLTDWVEVEDAVYGHGGREGRLFPTGADDRGRNGFFRVVVTDAPTSGFAPWTVSGITLKLDDRADGNRLQFLSETNGVKLGASTDPFVYTLARTGTNELRLETRPAADNSNRLDRYLFNFVTPSRGTWVRDEYRKGTLKDRRTGTFIIAEGAVSTPPDNSSPTAPAVPAEIPSLVAGLAYSFQSGATPERLEFGSASTGIEYGDDVADDEKNTFTYTYSQTDSNTASLVVTFKSDKWDEYDLSYSSAAQGTFVRREFKNGVLDDTDRGAFSAVGSTSSSTPSTPPSGTGSTTTPPTGTDTNTPPSGGSLTMPTGSLTGFTYVMDNGSSVPVKLIFATATAGTELDDSAPSQFTYTFKVTSANTASLVLQFKPDRWDEYDLTYLAGSGSFVRREFDNNALKRTLNGSFTGTL